MQLSVLIRFKVLYVHRIVQLGVFILRAYQLIWRIQTGTD